MIDNLSDAVTVAETGLTGAGCLQPSAHQEMDEFVRTFRPADLAAMNAGELDDDITRLSHLLHRLGMRDNAQTLIQQTLRHMELIEAGHPVFPSSAWNRIAVQLALHGDLDEARLVLTYALSRAREDTAQSVVILTNLSAVSLGSNDAEFAERWAERARAALSKSPDLPGADRLRTALASVQVSIMKERGDSARLEDAVMELGACTASLINAYGEEGEERIEVLEALATLADAQVTLARSTGSLTDMRRALRILERAALKAMAVDGQRSPLALAAHANLAGATLELTQSAGLKNADAHMRTAAERLESVVELTFAALGEHHPQSTATVDNLATLRDGSPAVVGVRQSYTHFYGPRHNERRNFAKSEAMSREKEKIRIIAFGGASYFMGPLDRYKPIIEERLSQGVAVQMIISSPWNTEASYQLIKESDESDPKSLGWHTPDAALRLIEDGDYAQTFTPVIDSYRRLRAAHGDRVELRVYTSAAPATSLLTSDACFFEPYATPDLTLRTRRPLRTFEVEYSHISHFYEMEQTDFDKFWNISLTVEEYETWEGELKALLRRQMEIVSAAKSDRST
ncbi:hypothetical protein AQJ23_28670 [Streptomyces antibioticus]|nr:hypothetical protein [Streptomyces antibioticus]KUN22029.1 hypothetical protein AQJ23_28670 [Streptomyces antibioticus]